jgi:hypothetical protein
VSDINKIIEDQKRKLEAKLALNSGSNLRALLDDFRHEGNTYHAKIERYEEKIKEYKARISVIGATITDILDKAIEAKILEALKNAPQGMSLIEISDLTHISFASVANWVENNGATVKTEGKRMGKRVFLV